MHNFVNLLVPIHSRSYPGHLQGYSLLKVLPRTHSVLTNSPDADGSTFLALYPYPFHHLLLGT